jgi:fibronectin type 3 domain-containing protein
MKTPNTKNSLNSFFTLFALVLVVLGAARLPAFANTKVTLPFYDEFPSTLSPDGGSILVVDSANWTNTAGSATFTNIIVAAANGQTYSGLKAPPSGASSKGASFINAATNDMVGVQLASAITTNSVYVSFLLKVTGSTTGSRMIFEMNTSSGGAVSSPAFGMTLNNDNSLSLFKSGAITNASNTTGPLTTNQTYLVVVNYNIVGTYSVGTTDDTLNLWLNPAPSTLGVATAPAATIAYLGDSTNADMVATTGFKTVDFGLLTTSAGSYDFDEVRVGTNWAQVTPSSAPNVPTGVGATPLNSAVTISWTASASDSYHPNATGYNVKRSTTSGGPYTTLAAGTNVSSSPFTDTTVVNGTPYYYVVTAVSSAANTTESTNSSPEVSATPTGASPPTTSPTISSVAPGCTSVALTWNSISDATKYYIYRKVSGGSYGTALATNVGVNNTNYVDNTAVAGTSYVYAATSVNANGENPAKNDSAAVAINTPGIGTQPASVAIGDGYTASFSVVATGLGLSYEWFTNNGSGYASAGTGATYTTPALTTNYNGLLVKCVVTGTGGCSSEVVTSSVATLNVGTHYRSVSSGNWSGAAPAAGWQISFDGTTSWLNADPSAIPGASDTVEIQTNTTVTVDANESCASLTIDNGGSLQNANGSVQTTLHLYGNLQANNGTNSFALGSTAHATILEFDAGNCHWTGSGDISVGKYGITVASGDTLDISGVTNVVKFQSSGTLKFMNNGTLIAGNTVISIGNNSNCYFTNQPGATLVTANPNGLISGSYNPTPDSTTPTLDFPSTQASLSTSANYVFNGTTAQVTAGLPSAANSLTISNSAGVSLSSSVAITGQLQINGGFLTPNDNTSTAGTLSFNGGVTVQQSGTWGTTASSPSHVDNTHFGGSAYVTILSGPKYFKSVTSGDWAANATWSESTDGTSYSTPAVNIPDGSSVRVEIQTGNTVSISANQTISSVIIDAGGNLTTAPGVVVTLVAGTGTTLALTNNGTFVNQGTNNWSQWALNAGATYIHKTLSAPGTGAYANAIIDPASTWIFAGTAALTTPIATSGRTYGNLIIQSADGSAYTPAAASTGTLTVQGDFTLGSNVTLSNTQTGAWIFNGNFTNNGTLNNYSNEVVTFTGVGKTLAGTANPIPFVDFNISSGASITIAQNVHATRDFAMAGNAVFNVNKSSSPSNVLVTVDGTISNTGSGNGITVNNGGPALVAGDSFKLFSGPVVNGNLLTVSGGGLTGSLSWSNSLAIDGSIKVISTVVTPPVLGVTHTGNTLTFEWSGAYKLQSQTNTLGVGLKAASTNWFDYPGGSTSPVGPVTINPTNGAVFFRLAPTP